jgi:large subunit ribosomal protein L21
MFAIIRADGKQYRVAKGDIIRFDRMKSEPGDLFETSQVLAIAEEDNKLKIGSPVVEGAKVEGTVLEHGKDKKIIVFKRKRRKTYRRKYGHRQDHTLVMIDKISAKSSIAKKTVQKKVVEETSDPQKISAKKPAAKKTSAKKPAAKKPVAKKTKEDQPTS